MSGKEVAEMIADIVKAIRARRKKAQAKAGSAGSTWEAMILQEAGPNRSDVIRPARQVHLERHD